MTIPTLETDSGALELRIADGIEANSVAFDNVWHWPDGVSAGDGDVPKDGGGTVKVSTFLTEIIAGAVYIIHKNLAFGDGSTSSYFTSLNEMIYFEDGNVFAVKSAATLQLGELSGGNGINGSCWFVNSGSDLSMIDSATAIFNMYGSTLSVDSSGNYRTRFYYGEWVDSLFVHSNISHFWYIVMNNCIIQSPARVEIDGAVQLSKTKVYTEEMTAFIVDITLEEIEMSGFAPIVRQGDDHTFTLVNLKGSFPSPLIGDPSGVIIEQYTVNIHIGDSSGSDLQGATVVMESYGNVVKNASTFYRCLIDHTAGTFATDLSAGKWIVTTSEIAAKAGVTGVDAKTGLWTTGADYIKAETLFSEVTDASGDISQQTENYKRWKGTSVVLGSYAPDIFTISKDLFTTSVQELIAPTIISGTVQPLDLKWELESAQVASSAMTLPAMTMAGYEFPPVLVRPLVLASPFETELVLESGVN